MRQIQQQQQQQQCCGGLCGEWDVPVGFRRASLPSPPPPPSLLKSSVPIGVAWMPYRHRSLREFLRLPPRNAAPEQGDRSGGVGGGFTSGFSGGFSGKPGDTDGVFGPGHVSEAAAGAAVILLREYGSAAVPLRRYYFEEMLHGAPPAHSGARFAATLGCFSSGVKSERPKRDGRQDGKARSGIAVQFHPHGQCPLTAAKGGLVSVRRVDVPPFSR